VEAEPALRLLAWRSRSHSPVLWDRWVSREKAERKETYMDGYRLYFLSAADKIEAAEVYEVTGDADAIAWAYKALRTYAYTDAIEIWQAKRFVARVTRNPLAANRT
jgi:hypothetical protein